MLPASGREQCERAGPYWTDDVSCFAPKVCKVPPGRFADAPVSLHPQEHCPSAGQNLSRLSARVSWAADSFYVLFPALAARRPEPRGEWNRKERNGLLRKSLRLRKGKSVCALDQPNCLSGQVAQPGAVNTLRSFARRRARGWGRAFGPWRPQRDPTLRVAPAPGDWERFREPRSRRNSPSAPSVQAAPAHT
jgi:hypothetical protein